MKPSSEFNKFSVLVGRVLSVPKMEILRREAEYEKQAALNPKRRGPKRKPKPSASPRPCRFLEGLFFQLLPRQLCVG
jgi:hypothetical protein